MRDRAICSFAESMLGPDRLVNASVIEILHGRPTSGFAEFVIAV